MLRAVVLILVALQVLTPPGVCLRECSVMRWLTRTTATPRPSKSHVEPAGKPHRVTCCSGCHGRAAQVRDPSAPGDAPARVGEDRTPLPNDPHPDSDCRATCKATADKFAHHENPQ